MLFVATPPNNPQLRDGQVALGFLGSFESAVYLLDHLSVHLHHSTSFPSICQTRQAVTAQEFAAPDPPSCPGAPVRTAQGHLHPPAGLRTKEYGRLSLIHISEPTRRTPISYAVFC